MCDLRHTLMLFAAHARRGTALRDSSGQSRSGMSCFGKLLAEQSFPVWRRFPERVKLRAEDTGSVHRRDPATDRHGSFDLLRLRPGPVHPSLGDLVTPGSPRITISMPALAWTPARHSPLQPRTPGLSDPPASASPELGLQAQATVPGCSSGLSPLPITPGAASGAPQRCSSTVGGAAGAGRKIELFKDMPQVSRGNNWFLSSTDGIAFLQCRGQATKVFEGSVQQRLFPSLSRGKQGKMSCTTSKQV
ncbi:uncharacterized protein LOC131574829 [Poecile atricapillus]|uniref:uncharacterized protein LOC131574829 n=1 Tax=Poecile atricapillus TaxID=48891 RepID=UPI002739B3D6|nr:uncharacterized protein LOC131574829 [Poecile atricapillus]